MSTLEGWFASGAIALAACAVLAIEFLALVVVFKRPASASFFAALPGVFLLLAVWSALSDRPWTWTAFFLALSFPSHLLDLWRRRP